MKSIKYLLIALIVVVIYESSVPKTFNELSFEDWIFLLFFGISFWVGIYSNNNGK